MNEEVSGQDQFQHDPEDPEAETILLERVGDDADPPTDETYGRLLSLLVGEVVSTGDRFAGFEIVEIVPPDEPALVTEQTRLEFV